MEQCVGVAKRRTKRTEVIVRYACTYAWLRNLYQFRRDFPDQIFLLFLSKYDEIALIKGLTTAKH